MMFRQASTSEDLDGGITKASSYIIMKFQRAIHPSFGWTWSFDSL